ncbi:MAG: undecaprenyl-phosphate glucose phosphotransferase [Steroidobacteraceae bacterium]
MNDSVYFKKSLSIGLLTVAGAFIPTILAGLCLYLAASFYDEPFNQSFQIMMVIVIGLCTLVMQPARNIAQQLTYDHIPQAMEIIGRWLILLFILMVIGFLTKITNDFPRRVLLTWAVTAPALIVVVNFLFQRSIRRLLRNASHQRRVVLVGCNEASLSLAERIRNHPELCMSVEGFFDDRNYGRLGNPENVNLLGGFRDLAQQVKARGVEVIFVALPVRHLQRVMDLLDDLRDTTASIYYVPDIFVFDLIQARTGDIMGVPVVAMCETPFYGLRGLSKRLLDIGLASTALLLGLPVLLLIVLAVKMSSPGPVIFKQRRYGLDGEEITVYKFRSMTVTEDGPEIRQATQHDTRTTAIGRFLRRSSLDELPQLINVIQGRMSLVGPRPHAVAHNEMYRKLIKGYMVRHKVLPGITGLAQINGCRGETKDIAQMEARVHYDLEYLRHWSTLLDLKILAITVLKIFTDKRAY